MTHVDDDVTYAYDDVTRVPRTSGTIMFDDVTYAYDEMM